MPITTIIIEDDPHYNLSLKKVIDSVNGITCLAQCHTFDEAVLNLKIHNPHVALVDIRLGNKNGIDIIDYVAGMGLKTQYIVCSAFEDDQSIIYALKCGASGYLVKGESIDKIVASIKETHQGGVPLTSSVARRILLQFKKDENSAILKILTKTEQDVIKLLSKGLLYKEIAIEQNVSLDTIRKHLSNIYKKLGVNNKIEAINKVI